MLETPANLALIVTEMVTAIRQIKSPYCQRVVDWLSDYTGQDMQSLETGLSAWLEAVQADDSMFSSYRIGALRMTIETVRQIFGSVA
jgi:hypothetical protein